MGFRGPRLGSCSGIGLSVRLEKQGPARRARRLTNRAGSVAARTEVGSHPAVADRRPNHTQDVCSSVFCWKYILVNMTWEATRRLKTWSDLSA